MINFSGDPPLSFLPDGTRKFVELYIVNLQPHDDGRVWEEIGTWKVTDTDQETVEIHPNKQINKDQGKNRVSIAHDQSNVGSLIILYLRRWSLSPLLKS